MYFSLTGSDNFYSIEKGRAAIQSYFNGDIVGKKLSSKELRLLVFTDLDGTLLDHKTYSFEPALPAVNALKAKNIPLIFCTSKTRAEIEKIRSEIQNSDPFISENGGAVFIPKGCFSHKFQFSREDSNYFIIELGTPYPELRKALNQISAPLPEKIKGFGDFTAKEVAHLCGFSSGQAELAKEREYDEPFILNDESLINEIQKMARRLNLQVSRGGRFYHLTGNNDKGKAVLILRNLYKKNSKNLKTIGVGDSLNDLPMLEAVDYPILVQKPDGSHDPLIKLDCLILVSGAGPAGWSEGIFSLLKELEKEFKLQ